MTEESDIRTVIAGVFDEDWYLHTYPDVADAGVDPISHYLSSGADEGRDPHPLFDTSWYADQNPEVRQTGLNALAHYLLVGAAGGKDPHPLFATSWYSEQRPQIHGTSLNPLLDYIGAPAQSRVSPHPLFDSAWYLRNNPDVAEAGVDPLLHYIGNGAREGRSPNPLFDPAWYLRQCSDERPHGMTALEHYLIKGAARGLDPHPLFDTDYYAEQCTRSQLASINPLEHYLRFGVRDAFRPHPLFDSRWYLEKYPEVLDANVNPLVHYLLEGAGYGTEPHCLFRGNWYLRHYEHNIPPGMNPLLHYVLFGAKNHRDPSPEFSGRFYTDRYRDADWERTNPLSHYITIGRAQGRSPAPMSVLYREIRRAAEEGFSDTGFEALRHISSMAIKPKFLIVTSGEDDRKHRITTQSLLAQIYKNFIILSVSDILSFVERSDKERDVYLIWLEAGDVLKPAALYHFACAINRVPTLDLIYGDEEIRSADGDIIPFYKPAWSPDYLESFNYIGRSICYRLTFAGELLASAEDPFDFLLRVTEKLGHIGHVREMISTCPDRRHGSDTEVQADLASLNRRCRRLGRHAEFVAHAQPARLYRLGSPITTTAKISIVLYSTRAITSSAVDLSYPFLRQIAPRSSAEFGLPEGTTIEVIPIAATLDDAVVSDPNAVRGSHLSGDVYTGSLAVALNRAVEAATGQYILFLSDVPQRSEAICLTHMVHHIIKPHIGAVGAKLIAADGRTAQFGLVLFDGMKHRVHHGSRPDGEDYFFSHTASRNFRAVELDALMTDKGLFQSVGGFDATVDPSQMAVDYCLAIQARGKMVVCDADTLVESEIDVDEYASGFSAVGFDRDRVFVEKWSRQLISDPYYNLERLAISPAAYDGRPQKDC
ncbi:hypothetical protein [Methylobacterium fujisawaense]|uniref:hypothetical protein n=1 Tax=Methylobacterium fujisawaense TaxID=107400 RepID=UPI0024483F79|nr:hypothetical protein [Methylobacterium fujisawaense]MDH3029816.1 hypothetical protein [Methylobacterium fujisawaense]